MEFVKDCLSRKMSLRNVANKWNITLDDVMDKYHEERSKLTDEQVERIMNEVYYEV
nr:MAG TPA: Translation initiation factor IF-2, N-terminal region [Caudoviricetes sp.]